MSKLAEGMTVQSRAGKRVAFCVRCSWESDPTTYKQARETACNPNSHDCHNRRK